MTVAELIAELEEFDPAAEVRLDDSEQTEADVLVDVPGGGRVYLVVAVLS